MKLLFYILSLLVIVAAAWFSNDNKKKFVEQQQFRIDMISQNQRVSAQAEKTDAQLKAEQKKLKDAKDANAEVEQSIASLESKERELRRELGEIEAELESQNEKLAAAEKAREEVINALRASGIDGPVDFDTLNENIKSLEDKRKVLRAEIAELETNIEGAEKNIAKNRDEIQRLGDRKADRDRRIAGNARESVITAVDSDWGFVVIGAGRSSGFEPKGRLIVKRDGRSIAEVVPSSVEASQTIAEIDYETLSPGVVLQPGDRVMRVKPAGN